MKLAEILTGPETWGKGSYGNLPADTRHCLMGGIYALLGYDVLSAYAPAALRERARIERLVQANIEVWNDDAARTWEEVASVIDAYDRDRMLNP